MGDVSERNAVELKGLRDALNEDYKWIAARLDESQSAKRIYVRTIFANFEAILWSVRRSAAWSAKKGRLQATDMECMALQDQSFFVDNDGDVKDKTSYVSLIVALKMVFKITTRGLTPAPAKLSEIDLTSIKAGIAIRNRLTHPKNEDDCEVSDADLAEIGRCGTALFKCLTGILDGLERHQGADKAWPPGALL